MTTMQEAIANIEEIRRYFPNSDENTLKELADYYKDIKVLSREKVSIQFTNKGPEHAAIVMSEIFAESHKRVKIFAGNFEGMVSNNELYISKLQAFLDKPETNVDVIFSETPNRNSEALALLKERRIKNSKQVELRIATPQQLQTFKSYIVNEHNMVHFTIGDNELNVFNKYRCETDIRKFVAILNFDDNTDFCDTLRKMHDILSYGAAQVN